MPRYYVRCGECGNDDLHFPEPDEKTGEDGGNLTCSDPKCGHDGLHDYEEAGD